LDAIKGVLKEELQNSLEMKRDYKRELEKLPKGVLIKKIIRGHEYYYLIRREGGKVRFDYKGKPSSEEIKQYEEAKKLRKKYRQLLSQVNKQIKYLSGILRDRKSV
jgi:hypothetical protein